MVLASTLALSSAPSSATVQADHNQAITTRIAPITPYVYSRLIRVIPVIPAKSSDGRSPKDYLRLRVTVKGT